MADIGTLTDHLADLVIELAKERAKAESWRSVAEAYRDGDAETADKAYEELVAHD